MKTQEQEQEREQKKIKRLSLLDNIYNTYLSRNANKNELTQYYKLTTNKTDIRKIVKNILDTEEYKTNIFLPKDSYNSVIPLNVYVTWHTTNLPPKMKENYDNLKRENLQFKYYLYDDKHCREFIKNNFDNSVVNAFDKLVPGAYKADLWRYCVLYINGGIYIDVKYKCTNGFKLIALTEKEHWTLDRCGQKIYNALMVCLPKNEILLSAINQIVKNVNNKFYGDCSLSPTGPGLLSNYFSEEEKLNFELKHKTNEGRNYYKYILYNGKTIFKVYKHYKNEQNKFQKTTHYGHLWHEKKIYN